MEEESPEYSVKKPTDVSALVSAVPFSSVLIVVVLAIAKPDQFQDVLEIGREYFGVNNVTLIGQDEVMAIAVLHIQRFCFLLAGGSLVAATVILLLLQQLFFGVKALYASMASWKDEDEAKKREREALVALFNATGGKCW